MHINPDGTKQLAFSPRWILSYLARLGIVCTKEDGQRGRMTEIPPFIGPKLESIDGGSH